MSTTDTRAAVAAEVRAAIARSGRSDAEVASAAGIHRATISRRLRGETSFTVEELVALAVALDVSVADLLPKSRVGSAA